MKEVITPSKQVDEELEDNFIHYNLENDVQTVDTVEAVDSDDGSDSVKMQYEVEVKR